MASASYGVARETRQAHCKLNELLAHRSLTGNSVLFVARCDGPLTEERRVSRIGVFTHVRTLEPVMITGLDTLLIALYVELTDQIIPACGFTRCGPGRPPEVTDGRAGMPGGRAGPVAL
jgi:hypothetical protein